MVRSRFAAALAAASMFLLAPAVAHAQQVTEERARLDQAWAALRATQAQVEQAKQAATMAQHQVDATVTYWQTWAEEQVAQARAQAADAERRRHNATATAERRARKIARLLAARSHPAS